MQSLPNTLHSIPQIQHIWSYIKQSKFKLDAADYTHILKHCSTPHYSELGHDIFLHIQNNLQKPQIDHILTTSILNMLNKCNDSNLAISLWNDDLPADRVMYLGFLMACTNAKRYLEE